MQLVLLIIKRFMLADQCKKVKLVVASTNDSEDCDISNSATEVEMKR